MATKKKTSKKAAKKATKKSATKRAVKPVPRGYRTVTPTLVQDDANATLTFLRKAFGAKVQSKLAGPGRKIMHSEALIGDSLVMVSDAVQQPARPSTLFLYVPDVDKTVAKAAKAGATVVQPPEDMFWGDRYAVVTDPQGNQWSIGSRVENVKPDEMKKRMKAAAKQMTAGA